MRYSRLPNERAEGGSDPLPLLERHGEHRRDEKASAPEILAAAVATARSTSPATTTREGSSSGASRPAAGPKRTTRRAARRASAQASSSRRCSSGDACTGRPTLVSSPPATSTTERSGRSRRAAAVFAGVAAIPSSTSTAPSRLPTTTARSSGRRSPSRPAGIAPAAVDAATAASSACRRGPSRPAGSASTRSSPLPLATIVPSRRNAPSPTSAVAENPTRRPGDTAAIAAAPSSSSFATTTSPEDCPRAIVSFAPGTARASRAAPGGRARST